MLTSKVSVSYYPGSPGTFCRWPYPEVSRCVDIEGFLYHIIRTVKELFTSDLTQKWAVVLTSKVFCIILSGQWPYPEVSRCVDIEGFLYHIIGAVQELFAGDLTQKCAVVLTSKVFCIILSYQSRNFLPVTLPRSEPLCWHRRFSVSYYRGSPGTFYQWPYPEVSRCVDIEGFLYHIIGAVQELFAGDLTQKWAVVLTSKVFCIILSDQELFAGDLTQKWAVVLTSKVFCIILSDQELFAGDLTQKWAVVLTSKVFCIILSGQSRNFLPVTLPRSVPLCWHRRFSVSYYRGSLGTFCQWPYPEVSRCVDIEGFLYHIIGAV